MGLRDTAEQLEAAQAQSVLDEALIAELQDRLRRRDIILRERDEQIAELQAAATDRDRQIAELEHDLARAESALADRLQHDAHAHPTALHLDRDELTGLLYELAVEATSRGDIGPIEIAGIADAWAPRITALAEPLDGVPLTTDEAALAIRACRHSAAAIATVLDVDPSRLHPEVASYVQRLTDLADRLSQTLA